MDYRNKKWKKKRNFILKKYHYMCQEAKRFGKTEEAQTVHHIFPVSKYPELAFTDWNLLPVTNANHNKFHDRATDEITETGKYWQRKRKQEFEDWKNQSPPKNDL